MRDARAFTLEPFEPLRHAEAVFALWREALGDAYPVAERVFIQNVYGNPYYEAGDGLVAVRRGRMAGFALAKLDRSMPPRREGAVGIVLVHPAHRRRGLGRRLALAEIERLRSLGVEGVGAGSPALYRFWPGVPADLEAGRLFFESLGFPLRRGIFDLVRSLADYEPPDRVRRDLERAGVEIGPARREEVPDILRFEQIHFPFWLDNFQTIIGLGGQEEIVVARERSGEVVGTLCSYSPASRFRSANLAWETLLGSSVGGLGSVGVAESRRGRGIGLALCAEALRLLKGRGVGQCHVDWTGHVDFYGKLGFRVWREYWMGVLPAQKA